jgi:hypothetical protein
MKTEAEIRKHRDDLLKCMKKPCGCTGTEHELPCFIGSMMMKSTADMLGWVLGEAPERDRLVERMAQGAREL